MDRTRTAEAEAAGCCRCCCSQAAVASAGCSCSPAAAADARGIIQAAAELRRPTASAAAERPAEMTNSIIYGCNGDGEAQKSATGEVPSSLQL